MINNKTQFINSIAKDKELDRDQEHLNSIPALGQQWNRTQTLNYNSNHITEVIFAVEWMDIIFDRFEYRIQ